MHEISLRAEEIFRIGSFVVTNSLLLSTFAVVLLLCAALVIRRRFSLVPSGAQNVFEVVIEQLLELMESVLGSRRAAEKYFPLVATIFLFVISCNWLGLLPGIGSIIVKHGVSSTPLFRSPAADLNFTLALATVTMFAIHIIGISVIGIKKHGRKFLSFKNPISFFVGLLELISEFAKIVSFSFRLFGNVFAGEVLLGIIAFLVPYLIPLPFLFLEIFVGFIQAFIFSMLTLVFIASAITEPEH